MPQPTTRVPDNLSPDYWLLQKYALDKHAIVAITDPDGRIEYVNDLFCEISGYTRDELIGRTHHMVNSGHHSKQFFEEMFETLKDKDIWRGEICNRRKTGELYWVETTISALRDDRGDLTGYAALRTDVTDQHRTLDAMRRLHEITSDRTAPIDEKANHILALGCEIFNLPIGIISDIQGDTYKVRFTLNPENALKPGDTFELGNTFCSETMGCRNAVAHHHVGESQTRHHPAYINFGLESYIAAPLYVKNRLYGTINFSGPEPRARAFGSGEIELIQLFAKWIGDELAREETDAELNRQRRLLNAVSAQAKIGGWELDLRTQHLYWTPITRLIHEVDGDFTPTVENGINFYDGDEAREAIRQAIEHSISAGEEWDLELPLLTAKGRSIWARARGAAVLENGECIRLYGSFQDITEERLAASQQRKEAQRNQLMIESTAVGFWDWNIQTGETSFSERWADIIGYELSELQPLSIDTWSDACHPDDLVRSTQLLKQHWAGETDLYVCEARMKHKHGHWVWIHDTGRVIEWDADGKPLRMIGTHIDITENKLAQTEIDVSHQRIKLATESAGICIWEYNLTNKEMVWDDGMRSLYGVSDKPLSIEDWENSIHPEDHDWVVNKLQDAIRLAKPFDYEFRILRPDGKLRHVRTAAQFMQDDQATVERVVGMTSDISQQKESELALLSAKSEAESAAKAKSDFLATMSHEIRTPMNGVLGMLNLLKGTPLSEDQLNRVRIAQNSAQSLLSLINDILDFSKIEANKLELETIEFNINQVITESVESLASQAESKDVEILIDTSRLHTTQVMGDPGRVRQILTNLLNNAIKFTDEGQVTVQIDQVNKQDNWLMTMEVRDTGIGIDQHKIEKLFSAFNQLDTSTSRQFGGTGLGLAIVKNLCERMHGGITVESQAGVGSTFTAQFILGHTNQSPAMPEMTGVRVLSVIHHPKLRELTHQNLELLGAKVVSVATTADAAESLLIDPSSIDLLLLDNAIPGENWRDSAAALSQLPAMDTALRLLLVPMSFRHSKRSLDSGDLHGLIMKPLNVLDLAEYYLTRNTYQRTAIDIQPGLMPDFRNKRVLLVEDNRVNQLVAEEMLTALGIQVSVAEHGEEAIKLISESSAPFDMILMDCQMPILDGYQATRAIRHGRAGEEHQSTPVIAMTAHAMTGDKERCLASGMNDYLAKPVDPSALHTMLERWLLDSISSDPAAQPPSPAQRPSNLIWDRPQALKRVVGNEKLLNQLIDMFRSEQPERLIEMTEMLLQRDFEALRETAHNLKGVAGNLGLVAVQKVAAELDAALRSGQTHRAESLIDELHEETARLNELLSEPEKASITEPVTDLKERLVAISHALEQNDYISQKSLEFMLKPLGNAYYEAELGQLAHEITAFENAKAQSRIKSLLQQITESYNNDK
ncbi:MAG: PAS domain-containing protein [Pseudomonadota bacterium]|nr:PAS domain-containing protein [Pseudomonadota bacterium]